MDSRAVVMRQRTVVLVEVMESPGYVDWRSELHEGGVVAPFFFRSIRGVTKGHAEAEGNVPVSGHVGPRPGKKVRISPS